MKGIFAVYKPKGPTSHNIVDAIRKMTGERRVGHAGTLDPLASGVLVVGVGREATRRLALEVKKEKEYLAAIKLGEFSSTDDEEGEKTNVAISLISPPDESAVQQCLIQFVGEVEQMPPTYSALKIKGTPAYKLARAGKKVELAPRRVQIKEVNLIEYKWPLLKIRVVCGPGVYIRSLARDIGQALNTGCYLADLVRTRVGDYNIEDAVHFNNLKNQ